MQHTRFSGDGYSCGNTGLAAVIVGGVSNKITQPGNYGFIGGGSGNHISGQYGVIGGGNSNLLAFGGEFGTIAGGLRNTNAWYKSTIGGGELNRIAGAGESYATIPGGYGAHAISYGQMAHANGFFTQVGDAQTATYVVRGVTTDTNLTELLLDGVSKRMTMPANAFWSADVTVAARSSVGHFAIYRTSAWWVSTGLSSSGSEQKVVVAPNACCGSSQVTRIAELEVVPSWDIVVGSTAAAPHYPAIFVRGAADQTVRWVAVVRVTQVAWP